MSIASAGGRPTLSRCGASAQPKAKRPTAVASTGRCARFYSAASPDLTMAAGFGQHRHNRRGFVVGGVYGLPLFEGAAQLTRENRIVTHISFINVMRSVRVRPQRLRGWSCTKAFGSPCGSRFRERLRADHSTFLCLLTGRILQIFSSECRRLENCKRDDDQVARAFKPLICARAIRWPWAAARAIHIKARF